MRARVSEFGGGDARKPSFQFAVGKVNRLLGIITLVPPWQFRIRAAALYAQSVQERSNLFFFIGVQLQHNTEAIQIGSIDLGSTAV
jgi:hypothetical protein